MLNRSAWPGVLLAFASCPLAGVLPAQENPTARLEKLDQELKAHKEAAY
jgi:hypothetical protein